MPSGNGLFLPLIAKLECCSSRGGFIEETFLYLLFPKNRWTEIFMHQVYCELFVYWCRCSHDYFSVGDSDCAVMERKSNQTGMCSWGIPGCCVFMGSSWKQATDQGRRVWQRQCVDDYSVSRFWFYKLYLYCQKYNRPRQRSVFTKAYT